MNVEELRRNIAQGLCFVFVETKQKSGKNV